MIAPEAARVAQRIDSSVRADGLSSALRTATT